MNRAQRRAKPRKRNPSKADIGLKYQMIQSNAIDIAVQKHMQLLLWSAVVALNEEAGFGKERTQRFLNRIGDVWEEWTNMAADVDLEYAAEKLRMRAEQISGIEIGYVEDIIREQLHNGGGKSKP